jgi:hypothetical protein
VLYGGTYVPGGWSGIGVLVLWQDGLATHEPFRHLKLVRGGCTTDNREYDERFLARRGSSVYWGNTSLHARVGRAILKRNSPIGR